MKDIELNHLSKTYKLAKPTSGWKEMFLSFLNPQYIQVHALKNVSFYSQSGEKIGLLGPNGSGKTTIMKLLSGILHPSAGTVRVNRFNPFNRKKEYLKSIAFIMGQKSQLWWDLPARDTFLLMKAIYEIPERKYLKTLEFLVDGFNVSSLINKPVRKLSLGERMKMEIISSLLHTPKILLLDEPTIGLDHVSQIAIRNMLDAYNKQFNTTLILTSHYLKDVTNLCDRILVLKNGTLIYDGDLDNLKKKYSNFLVITVKSSTLNEKFWQQWGTIDSIEGDTIIVHLLKENLPYIMDYCKEIELKSFFIEEPPLEEALSGLFHHEANRS